MFNETAYNALGSLGDRTPECEAIKANCDSRFPVNDDPTVKRDLNWECMKATGYTTQCMDNKSYENPGSSTYWLDAATNPDNPGYLLPNLGLGSLNTPALLAIAAVIVGFVFFRH